LANVDIAKKWVPPCDYNDSEMLEFSKHCESFLRDFNFIKHRTVKQNYPLAFVIIPEQNAEQIVRLLQVLLKNNEPIQVIV